MHGYRIIVFRFTSPLRHLRCGRVQRFHCFVFFLLFSFSPALFLLLFLDAGCGAIVAAARKMKMFSYLYALMYSKRFSNLLA